MTWISYLQNWRSMLCLSDRVKQLPMEVEFMCAVLNHSSWVEQNDVKIRVPSSYMTCNVWQGSHIHQQTTPNPKRTACGCR